MNDHKQDNQRQKGRSARKSCLLVGAALVMLAAGGYYIGGFSAVPPPATESDPAADGAPLDNAHMARAVSQAVIHTPLSGIDSLPPPILADEGGDAAKESVFAGQFLASHFAQASYDWDAAREYLGRVIAHDPQNNDLLRRGMVLAMGTGDAVTASSYAQKLMASEPENGFAHLIVAVDALARDDMKAAQDALALMPDGDMTAFTKPLLNGWAAVGQGRLDTAGLAAVPLHLYHGALMAFVLGDKEQARAFVAHMMQVKGLTHSEALRVADMLVALDEREQALGLYRSLREQEGAAIDILDHRIAALAGGDEDAIRGAIPPLGVKKARQGAALALYDMAAVLFLEESDSSTKLFAHMALAIDPDLTDARLLLGELLVRNERYDEAIEILLTVPESHPSYQESRRTAAELMARAGRRDEGLAMMEKLYADHGDVEALIRIGDIHRYAENYGEALKAYSRAVAAVGEPVPEKYWHLLYARGMVYEREGRWDEAVADLGAAVAFRPNHPYLLNYLGYGWADKGENLEEALTMIRRAVALRPSDGYITDSLGWVLYRMHNYDEAVQHLERAVELLPYDATINDHLGDAYWRVGRRMEARFQWRRAQNSSKDEELRASIAEKLQNGLPEKDKAALNISVGR